MDELKVTLDKMQRTQKCMGLSLLHLSYSSPSLPWKVAISCSPSPAGCSSARLCRALVLETSKPSGARGQGAETALESTDDLTRERRKPCLVSSECLNCLIISFLRKNTSESNLVLKLPGSEFNDSHMTLNLSAFLFAPLTSKSRLSTKTPELEESFDLPVKSSTWS